MRIGLSLSGGGARGFAHVGVLKVLDENNITVNAIAGSSMGSVIGAMYASGLSAKRIEEIILRIRLWDLFKVIDFSFSKKGLVKGEKAISYLLQFVPAKKFEDLKVPLVVNAVDLTSEKEILFKEGDLATALSASTSIPGIVVPVEKGGKYLVDGGLRNPLASGILEKIDFSILVNVTTGFGKGINFQNPTAVDIFKQSINIMQDEIIRLHLRTIEEKFVLIQPPVEKSTLWDIKHSKELIDLGEKAGREKIELIMKHIS